VLHVFNKADACQATDGQDDDSLAAYCQPTGPHLRVSARTGDGLQALRQHLLQQAGWQAPTEGMFMARQRHVVAMQQASEHLACAQLHANQRDQALDLFAEELRLAHEALGGIVGAFTPDDLLGEIFGRFCIGK